MKIKIILLFLLCICILLAGCNAQTASVTNFYYLTQPDYESPQGNIDCELHKGQPDPLAYKELLNNYLSGPNSKEFINPFPSETYLVSITVEQQTATVIHETARIEDNNCPPTIPSISRLSTFIP